MGKIIKSEPAARANLKRRNDIILIAVLMLSLLAVSLVLFLSRTEGDTVTVSLDGQFYDEYSLHEDRIVEIRNGEGYNILVIEGGRAYVKKASCPDGICSAHRPIGNSGESIICLPNKVVIEVRSAGKTSPDIIA